MMRLYPIHHTSLAGKLQAFVSPTFNTMKVLHLLFLLAGMIVMTVSSTARGASSTNTLNPSPPTWDTETLETLLVPPDFDLRTLVSSPTMRTTPVVLQGGSPTLWPAMTTWKSGSHFAEAGEVAWRNASAAAKVFVPVGDRRLSLGSVDDFEGTRAPVAAVFEPGDRAVYHTGAVESDVWRGYVEEETQWRQLAMGEELSSGSVWVGSPGVTANTHYDTSYNLHVQVSGRKQWVLYPPRATKLLAPFPWLHVHYRQAGKTVEELDAIRELELIEMRVTLKPGDVLYVPPFWWHRVTSLSTAMSIAVLTPAPGEWTASELIGAGSRFVYSTTSQRDNTLAALAAISLLVGETEGVGMEDVVGLVRARYEHIQLDIDAAGPPDRALRVLRKTRCFGKERAKVLAALSDIPGTCGRDPHAEMGGGVIGRMTTKRGFDVCPIISFAQAWVEDGGKVGGLMEVVEDGRRAIAADLVEEITHTLLPQSDGRGVGRFWSYCLP